MFLEISLYPNKILRKVNILIPPSMGIHGGGQQLGPPGGPGCEKNWQEIKININNKNCLIGTITKNIFLFIINLFICIKFGI